MAKVQYVKFLIECNYREGKEFKKKLKKHDSFNAGFIELESIHGPQNVTIFMFENQKKNTFFDSFNVGFIELESIHGPQNLKLFYV